LRFILFGRETVWCNAHVMRRLTTLLISDRTVMVAIVLNTVALFLHEIPAELEERGRSDGRVADPRSFAVAVRLFFVAAVFIGGILGLSLANAVFVDEMMMDNTADLERKVEALTDEIRALRDELSKSIQF
jgi:hypothetical protein